MLCPNCGATVSPSNERCLDCGNAYRRIRTSPAPLAPLRRLEGWAVGIYVGLGLAELGVFVVSGLAGPARLAAVLLTVLGVFLAAGCLITWTHRARRNLTLLPDAVPAQPAWMSLGGWFIPVGNLWLPRNAITDIAEQSLPASDSGLRPVGSGTVTGWWVTCAFGWYWVFRLDSSVPGALILLVSAVLCVRMVRGITAAQASRQPKAWL